MSKAPRYRGLTPSSGQASAAARGSSRKKDTKPELLLRRALWQKGYRYRKNRNGLPGSPDVVFPAARTIVFVDGDFWHGQNWTVRKAKLTQGHNAKYWVQKIEANMDRDLKQTRALQAAGWTVLRFWESDVLASTEAVVRRVEAAIAGRWFPSNIPSAS